MNGIQALLIPAYSFKTNCDQTVELEGVYSLQVFRNIFGNVSTTLLAAPFAGR